MQVLVFSRFVFRDASEAAAIQKSAERKVLRASHHVRVSEWPVLKWRMVRPGAQTAPENVAARLPVHPLRC
eukprot:3231350-Rhodomonas_salina.1